MIRYDLSPSEYHRDLDGPSLSSTTAHHLLTLSPAHAYLYHPRLGGQRVEPTDAMETGSLIDRMLVGDIGDIAVVEIADKKTGELKRDWRTDAAKQARSAARAAGKIAVLPHQMLEAKLVVDAIKTKLDQSEIKLDGKNQVALDWEARASNGNTVKCRGLLDHVASNHDEIWDLKMIASAHPDAISKAIEKRDYHVQAAVYLQGLCANVPGLQGREQYGLIFAETEPPYAVTPVRLGGDLLEIGQARWQRAIDLWERCLREECWPDYAAGKTLTVHASKWALLEHEDAMSWIAPSANWSPDGDGHAP